MMRRRTGRLQAPRRTRLPWEPQRAWHRLVRSARAYAAIWRHWSQRYVSRTTLYTRTVLLATAGICAALVFATLSEAWINYQLRQQVGQAQAANARLQQDATATARQINWAESPGAIENAARARGYVRPGEQAVAVAAATPARSTSSAHAPAAKGDGWSGHWLDWWRLFFGG
jgi:cell division protein FtsB